MAEVPAQPATWSGSDLEWMVYWALTKPLRKIPDVDFEYQASRFGGKAVAGGMVVDFMMLDGSNIALDIEGEYWHYGNSEDIANAHIRRDRLATIHITLIFIDGADIKRDVVYYTKEAIAGIDHSRMNRIQ